MGKISFGRRSLLWAFLNNLFVSVSVWSQMLNKRFDRKLKTAIKTSFVRKSPCGQISSLCSFVLLGICHVVWKCNIYQCEIWFCCTDKICWFNKNVCRFSYPCLRQSPFLRPNKLQLLYVLFNTQSQLKKPARSKRLRNMLYVFIYTTLHFHSGSFVLSLFPYPQLFVTDDSPSLNLVMLEVSSW